MKKLFRNLMVLSAGLIVACTNPEPMQPAQPEAAPETESHFVSAEEALMRLESTLHAFVPPTRTGIEAGTAEPVGLRTRAEGGLPSGYVVNFEGGGYAILSADDRKPAVVAFSEEGSLTAEAFEEDFRQTSADPQAVATPAWINALIRHYLTTPAAGDAVRTRAGESAVIEEQTAMLKTKWTDSAPYNSFIPLKGSKAGAANIALTQILIYNHRYHGVGLDEMNIHNPMVVGGPYNPDWSLLDIAALHADVPAGTTNGTEAGQLVASVGIANGTQFGISQSITTIEKVQTFMTDFWGYRLAQIKPFETTTMANLKKAMRTMIYTDKIPVYLSGDGLNARRHAWIADGWLVIGANNAQSSYIHCNFCVGAKYDLWLLFESNTPFSVLFPMNGTDTAVDFDLSVKMIDYIL